MDSDLITDLKQFISAGLARLEARIDALEARIDRVEKKIDSLEVRISGAEKGFGALDMRIEAVESSVNDHINYLAANLGQQIEEGGASLRQQILQLDQKVDDLMAGVSDSFESFDKSYQKQFKIQRQLLARLGV